CPGGGATARRSSSRAASPTCFASSPTAAGSSPSTTAPPARDAGSARRRRGALAEVRVVREDELAGASHAEVFVRLAAARDRALLLRIAAELVARARLLLRVDDDLGARRRAAAGRGDAIPVVLAGRVVAPRRPRRDLASAGGEDDDEGEDASPGERHGGIVIETGGVGARVRSARGRRGRSGRGGRGPWPRRRPRP